jgi:Skp family chaperone for outer membrane proteins
MHHKVCGAALLLAILPAAAMAQSTTPPADSDRAEARAKVRAACAADLQKFCANVERGKGAMRACLEEHQTNLSAECTAARAERAAARAKEKS